MLVLRRLWHDGHVVVIDVSQSVEKEHPRALDFLRMDAQNVTDFFRRRAVTVMTPRELFDYAVHAGLASQEEERAYVEGALARAESRVGEDGSEAVHESAEAEVAHAVFMASHIPTGLAGVRDAEAEVDKLRAGGGVAASDMYYATVTGTGIAPASAAEDGGARAGDGAAGSGGDGSGSDSDSSSEGGDDGDGGDEEEGGEGEGEGEGGGDGAAAFTKKGATKEERKAHQAAVKAANREKRKTKIPKHVKKRSVKAGGKK